MTALRSDQPDQAESERRAIVQAAMSILQRGGDGKLTRQALARLSGLAPATISLKFRSKSEVLAAVLRFRQEKTTTTKLNTVLTVHYLVAHIILQTL